jgi:hypothetical protein
MVASKPRTSLDSSFDVSGPWDTAILVWVRCASCGCTVQYEEGDSELEEILVKGCGIRKARFCRCNCHTGTHPLPILRTKRSE